MESFGLDTLNQFGTNLQDSFGFDDDLGGSFTDFSVPSFNNFSPEQFEFEDDFFSSLPLEQGFGGDLAGQTSLGQDFLGIGPQSTQQEFDDLFDPPSIAQLIKRNVFDALGIDEETGKLIGAFAKAAGGSSKQRQAQGRGRVGPGLPTSARAPTSPAGRISRAGGATSGEKAVQRAIQQSQRATSAARAIANQMARAGTVTTTNDLADMISGATKPTGTKTKLPGTQLRQLAIPRTQMA